MGVMNAQDMYNELRFVLDNRQDLPNGLLLRWLNFAYTHVCNPKVYRHAEILTELLPSANPNIPPQPAGSTIPGVIVPGTLYVGLPVYNLSVPGVSGGGVMGVHSVKIVQNANPLYYRWPDYKNPREFDRAFATDYSGMPAYWTHGPGPYVRLRPFPDSTWNLGSILVRAWVRPAYLIDNPNSFTVLQDIWDEVIIVRAGYTGWRQLNRPDRAESLKLDFGILANEAASQQGMASEDHTESDVRYEGPMGPGHY